MSDDKADFDPRFDPAFQRGFEGGAPVSDRPADRKEPAARRSVLREPPVRESAPRATPPAAVAPPVATPVAAAQPAEEPTLVAVQDATEQPIGATDAEPSQARNPYLVILVVVAIVLVAVGVWLFVQSGDEFNSREVRSQGDYMSLDATIHMAPFIALLGGATAIGVLFMFASRWRRRR